MQFDLESVSTALSAMSSWEVVAVILGIGYIVLAAKESLWSWPFAFFSTLIYTIIFWEGALVSSSLLNFYYMVMAIYGFILWKGEGEDKRLKISTWSLTRHIGVIIFGISSSLLLGYLLSIYTEAKFVYLDAFVMVFSIITTWMLAKKVLSNWLYWIVIDTAAIVLYWQSGYIVTILLFMIYIVLAVYAYIRWRKVHSAL